MKRKAAKKKTEITTQRCKVEMGANGKPRVVCDPPKKVKGKKALALQKREPG